jgi:cytochrome c peroxidase
MGSFKTYGGCNKFKISFIMKKQLIIILVLSSICFIGSCSQNAPEQKKTNSKSIPDDITVLSALPIEVPYPPDNPITENKAALGKLLFYDPILSGNKDVACASCHHPEYGFGESLEISIGVNGNGLGNMRNFKLPNDIPFVKRNSQTIINTAFNGISNNGQVDAINAPMFWDLRVKSLELQSLEPIKAFEEMRGHSYAENDALEKVLNRLKQINEYQLLFTNAFGSRNAITKENLAKAIATYERTIISNHSRFDEYMRNNQNIIPRKTLSQSEVEGMNIFLKSGCSKCHNGPMFSDYKTHTMGVVDNEKLRQADEGYEKKNAFRTPSLRNLRFTYPYMHNGKIGTIKEVLEFYEDLSGGKISNSKINPHQIDPLVHKLKVDFKDISLIVEFLSALNDETYDKSIPPKVPSKLKVGGNIGNEAN